MLCPHLEEEKVCQKEKYSTPRLGPNGTGLLTTMRAVIRLLH